MSRTLTSAMPSAAAVVISTRTAADAMPTPRIASIALRTRFTSTLSTWPRCTFTAGKPTAKRSSTAKSSRPSPLYLQHRLSEAHHDPDVQGHGDVDYLRGDRGLGQPVLEVKR
jgi:hypothetical protein